MWRESKEQALGIKEVHSVEDHLHFLTEILPQEYCIYFAINRKNNEVVGLIACNESFVSQLYVHIDFQNKGVGTLLLQIAKNASSGSLQLRTFQSNPGAQAFYERHGFEVVGSGCDNEEQLPDLLYEWQR